MTDGEDGIARLASYCSDVTELRRIPDHGDLPGTGERGRWPDPRLLTPAAPLTDFEVTADWLKTVSVRYTMSWKADCPESDEIP